MLTIDIDNTEVLTALQNLQRRVDDTSPAMREIGEHIASEIDLCFRDAQDPYGNPWALLSIHSTLIREDEFGNMVRKGDKPLNDTGRLKNSITSNVIDGGHAVEIGTNVEYAITHQKGATQGQYGKTRRNGPIPLGRSPGAALHARKRSA